MVAHVRVQPSPGEAAASRRPMAPQDPSALRSVV
jgi:hypothetical protein